MPIGPRLAVGSVVDEKPLGLALDALVWPALFSGVVAIGVGQFPISGYRYFPYLLACSEFGRGSKYMCVIAVIRVMMISMTRPIISRGYSVFLAGLGDLFVVGEFHHAKDLGFGQTGCAKGGYCYDHVPVSARVGVG
jgi:hypothetical protein